MALDINNNDAATQSLQIGDSCLFGNESDDGVVGLVPYGFHTDSDDSLNIPVTSKKRKKRLQVQNDAWFVAQNKKRRECGKKYLGRKKIDNTWKYNVLKESKSIKKRCSCTNEKINATMRCAWVTDAQRQDLFKNFWLMDTNQKKIYVNTLVHSIQPSKPRNRKNPHESRRFRTLKYHFKVGDGRLQVCRTFFINTLSIGRRCVLNWVKKPLVAHENTSKVVEQNMSEEKKCLNLYFDLLPMMESHYCRALTSKKYLLPEWRSKQMIYDSYCYDWCATRNVRPLSITAFNSIFSTRNLGLFLPKKDQCDLCARYSLGSIPLEDYSKHQQKKEEARTEKQKDKLEESNVFTVDLQAVLMAPKSQVSSSYYRTKLQVHNLVFYNLINKKSYCFLWNEAEGGVNAEEFASVWMYFIVNKVLPTLSSNDGTSKIIFYSDGCTYQNRNCLMSNALLNVAMKYNIIIEQKILEPGHTQMKADSVHATIERAMRKRNIDVPAEYIEICKGARKNPEPYDVTYLNYEFFKKFNKIQFCKSIRPGRGKGDSKVTDVRGLRYTPTREIFYKLLFSDAWTMLPQRVDKNVLALKWCDLEQLYEERRPITARKFEDLQILKLTLPKDHHKFYDDLPHL